MAPKTRDVLFTIKRGQATEAELAAVVVALFSLVALHRKPPGESEGRSVPRWHRQHWAGIRQVPQSWKWR